VFTGSTACFQWPSGGQAELMTMTVMSNCVNLKFYHRRILPLIPFP
jgi:hypothetical protein